MFFIWKQGIGVAVAFVICAATAADGSAQLYQVFVCCALMKYNLSSTVVTKKLWLQIDI